jgi:hypothetical protein
MYVGGNPAGSAATSFFLTTNANLLQPSDIIHLKRAITYGVVALFVR